jgi:hypothetical protein
MPPPTAPRRGAPRARSFLAACAACATILASPLLAQTTPNAWIKIPLVRSADAAFIDGGEGAQVIHAIAVSERWNATSTDTNFMLMGTDVGGIYASRNGGDDWFQANVGYDARGASHVAIDPLNSNRGAAVGANDESFASSERHGIYLTGNKASTWTHALPARGYASRVQMRDMLAYDPSSQVAIPHGGGTVAASSRLVWSVPASTEIRFGSTWTTASGIVEGLLAPDGTWTWSVIPGSSAAGNGSVYFADNGVLYATNEQGFFRGVRSGSSWTFSQITLPDSGSPSGPAATGLTHRGADVWLTAATPPGSGTTPALVYRSTNYGASFVKLAVSGLPATRTVNGKVQRIARIAVNRSGTAQHFYARYTTREITNASSNNTIYYSTDALSWSALGAGAYDTSRSFIERQLRPVGFTWRHNANVVWTGGDFIKRSSFASAATPASFSWHSDGYNGSALCGGFNFGVPIPRGLGETARHPLLVSILDFQGGLATDTAPLVETGPITWEKLEATGNSWGGSLSTGFSPDGVERLVGIFESGTGYNRIRLRRSAGPGQAFADPAASPLHLVPIDQASVNNVPIRYGSSAYAVRDGAGQLVTFWGQWRRVGGGAWTPMWTETWDHASNTAASCKAVLTHSVAPDGTVTLWGITDLYISWFNPQLSRGAQIVRSTDYGQTWTKVVHSSFQSPDPDLRWDELRDIAHDPVGQTLYATTAEGRRLYRVNLAGWTANRAISTAETITNRLVADQAGARGATSVAVDPRNPRVVYTAAPGRSYASSTAAQRSIDGGATFSNLTLNGYHATPVDGAREAAWVRVHPETRQPWFGTSCYGLWAYPAPAQLDILAESFPGTSLPTTGWTYAGQATNLTITNTANQLRLYDAVNAAGAAVTATRTFTPFTGETRLVAEFDWRPDNNRHDYEARLAVGSTVVLRVRTASGGIYRALNAAGVGENLSGTQVSSAVTTRFTFEVRPLEGKAFVRATGMSGAIELPIPTGASLPDRIAFASPAYGDVGGMNIDNLVVRTR